MPSRAPEALLLVLLATAARVAVGFSDEFEKTERLLDRINLEQSIAAVFNKVAYGSTTKRSIPDAAYPAVTTLATPLLTTYRYYDGSDEFDRVDVKRPESIDVFDYGEDSKSDFDNGNGGNYGVNLEKDHVLPTTAPAADILKNNNNKNYENPNRYNNDRLKPASEHRNHHQTESPFRTTTIGYNPLKNARPTKSIYSKDVPSYVPPSRAFFTPPLPPEYLSPFADKPTLRGTNSDGFGNRRPLPPPSLMPNKDRIPFRPDIPKDKIPDRDKPSIEINNRETEVRIEQRKKTLNTPSHNSNLDRLGEFYGGVRVNESGFEYEKGYIPSITRILSGSNGRHDDISDILLKSVTATPNLNGNTQKIEVKTPPRQGGNEEKKSGVAKEDKVEGGEAKNRNVEDRSESVTIKKETLINNNNNNKDTRGRELTTQSSEFINLQNLQKEKANVTKTASDEIWLICWNVHIYLAVFFFVLLALYSIYKLIRFENNPHMFSKSSFLTIHLMLTVICLLRIFYLMYDPYNINKSFNTFLYDFFHNFPLSLLATTFAVLILFLLKRTLTHLKVKAKPVFLVIFGALHIFLCFCLSVSETLGHFEKASLIVCKPVFVLLALSLGVSYLYLYRIIKNVLAKKSQNLSEICTQNISYASHVTIAVALLFILLGGVHLYALFAIKIDRFSGIENHDWVLWGYELSVRVLEIAIILLLAIVVSLRMSPREKQNSGFPLFPCATSESSSDNMYPNNCNTNPNVTNYSRNEMIMDNININSNEIERPNLLKNAFQNDSFDKKSTLERYQGGNDERFERFERPKWGSDRFDRTTIQSDENNLTNFPITTFERNQNSSARSNPAASRKPPYDLTAKYYTKPRYDEYNDVEYPTSANVYSEPLDFDRSDVDRRSRGSSNASGRRSTTGRHPRHHPRPHLGTQTLPPPVGDSVLETDRGFVRFRMAGSSEEKQHPQPQARRHHRKHQGGGGDADAGHYSDD